MVIKSSATTLDIYAHTTDAMQHNAVANIERGIDENEVQDEVEVVDEKAEMPMTNFVPYKGKIRKSGTGCISELNDHLFEGRYSPMWVDGKNRGFNVYAKTREEVEVKLAELIVQVKAEKNACWLRWQWRKTRRTVRSARGNKYRKLPTLVPSN